MKKLTFLLVGLLAFTITSCSDEDPDINVLGSEQMTVAPVLEMPATMDYVVTETIDDVVGNETMEAGIFTWSPADSEYNGEIQYFVQLAPAGSNFVDSSRLFTAGVTDLSKAFTFGDLNNAMNRLDDLLVANGAEGFSFGESNAVDVRIVAIAGVSQATIYSEPITVNVTPYELIVVETPKLFLVGAPQAYYGLGAWDNTTAIEMRYIGSGGTLVFEAYVKVGADEGFKFIGQQGSWDNGNYGSIGGVQDGTLENSGGSGDIKVSGTDGPGLYYVQVDIDALTYKAIKMDWGIIGSATAGGWDNETSMTYDFATNKYSISASLADGELKFRSANTGNFIYNDAWKFNVGVSDPNVTYNPAATNFPITGGTYNLELTINFDGTAVVGGL